ncbi:MAG: hypothetical protein WAN46_07155 [Gammaproteobacteria bacterium]|jgi:hypothetical protein
MSGRRKTAHLKRIMASLVRATELPRPAPGLLGHDSASGSERAWKRFVEGDVALRMPSDLARRLEEYARQLNIAQPKLHASAATIAYLLLNWALDQQQLTDTEMDIIGAALAAEGNRANQALELLRERLQELEAFDAQRLMREVAELEQLRQDLSELCLSLKRMADDW